MHSDVVILKLWFAVHRMLQGCATDYVSFFLRQAAVHGGFSPLAPDKLGPLSTLFLLLHASHPPPISSFLFLARQIDDVLIRCGLITAILYVR